MATHEELFTDDEDICNFLGDTSLFTNVGDNDYNDHDSDSSVLDEINFIIGTGNNGKERKREKGKFLVENLIQEDRRNANITGQENPRTTTSTSNNVTMKNEENINTSSIFEKKASEEIKVDKNRPLEDRSTKVETVGIIPCQLCSEDDCTRDAITYCMECGLYMCSSCRRFHRKITATRGHSVALQQEIVATEFDQYKPSLEEDTYIQPGNTTYSFLDEKLVEPGKYSRGLTPTDNALCGPCQFDEVDEHATHYCQHCREYMCRLCFKFHQRLRKTCSRHHVIDEWDCEDFDTFVTTVDKEITKESKPLPTQISEYFTPAVGTTDHGRRSFDTTFQLQHNTTFKNWDNTKAGNQGSTAFQHLGNFNIKLTFDTGQCFVSGIDCFTDGRIILTDGGNNNVKLFSSGYQLLGNIDLQEQPADVAIVTDKKVAVSVPSESELIFMRTSSTGLSLLRTARTVSKYTKIKCRHEEIYAMCVPKNNSALWLHILTENGEAVSFIQLDLSPDNIPLAPHIPSLAVSPEGGTIYISDKNHCVSAFGLDGRRIFKNENFYLFDITSLAADSRNVYVCCKTVNSVFRISYDGRDCSKILTKAAGLVEPHSIAVKGNLLLVGLCDSDIVKVYSV